MADNRPETAPKDQPRMRPFERSLPMALLRAREAVMRGFRQMLRENGVNEQEWRIIRALVEVDRVEIGELAERVFILKPSATRTIKNMQARKLVSRSRSNSDQRRAYISLTPQGRELFLRIAPQSEAEYGRITKLVGENNMQKLYDLLREVTERLNAGSPTSFEDL